MGAVVDKAQARRDGAARRAAIRAAPDAAARNAALCAHAAAYLAPFGPVALTGYLPIRSEADPVPVMAAHPGPVGVPVIDGPGLPLSFRRWHAGVALVAGPFGAMIPEAGADLVPRVLLVPLLAWDTQGFRLGYGGGFYDRTLAALRARGPVTALGFAFAGQRMDAVPTGAHDQRLDALVCEDGVIGFG